MKCRKCEQKASIHMRQHKLALCRMHFLAWLPEQVQKSITRYAMFEPTDRILVAVSGGKDSLALWDILLRLGYDTSGVYLDLGIAEDGYSDHSLAYAKAFADTRGLDLAIIPVEDHLGVSIPEAASITRRGRQKPCSVCGLAKRHLMNLTAREGEFDVLVTGHNLDDEAAVLFGNTLTWQTGYLQRQWPVLEAHDGFIRKAKPLCRIYERETAAFAFLHGIEYMEEECPHAAGASSLYYKETLNRMERERPGLKLSFYLSFLRVKPYVRFDLTEDELDLKPCSTCGQPTTADGICAFCRVQDRVRIQLADLQRE